MRTVNAGKGCPECLSSLGCSPGVCVPVRENNVSWISFLVDMPWNCCLLMSPCTLSARAPSGERDAQVTISHIISEHTA